ncbi:hypothetical protein ACNKHR_23830 [Shigella flexneri]
MWALISHKEDQEPTSPACIHRHHNGICRTFDDRVIHRLFWAGEKRFFIMRNKIEYPD